MLHLDSQILISVNVWFGKIILELQSAERQMSIFKMFINFALLSQVKETVKMWFKGKLETDHSGSQLKIDCTS